MIALACVLLFTTGQLVTPADPGVHQSSERVLGQTPVSAMTGNGRLTVALDAAGRIVSFRWPSPGLYEHGLNSANGYAEGRMLAWAVDDGDALHWAGDTDGSQQTRTVIVENESTAGPYAVSQAAFVHPAADALYMRLRAAGDTPPERFVVAWRPSPTSRVIPELPVPAGNAGVVLTTHDSARVFVVKPHDHSAVTRTALESTSNGVGLNGIPGFDGPAIWLGLESYPEPASVELAPRTDAPSLEREPVQGAQAFVGPVDVRLHIAPYPIDGGWEAWLRISTGDAPSQLEDRTSIAALNPERPAQFYRQLEGAERFWELRLEQAQLPGEPGSPERELAKRALLTLLLLQDRSTGAIVRGPVSIPPLGLDRPSDSVWASHALARAGFTAEAQRHVRFLATAMRDGRRRTHDGSFADGYYADATEATPSFVLDTDHSAWFIWACRELEAMIPPGQRVNFLESVRGPVRRAGNFVHGWWDPVRRRPLASFDPDYLRDRARPEQLLTAFSAMDNAIALEGQSGERRSDWVSRRAELRALIDYHLTDDDGDWRLANPAPYWPMGAFPLTARVWDRILLEGIPSGEQVPAFEQARDWHFRIVAAKGRQVAIPSDLARNLARIAAESPYATASSEGNFWPDSLTAAHIFLALIEADAAQTQSPP